MIVLITLRGFELKEIATERKRLGLVLAVSMLLIGSETVGAGLLISSLHQEHLLDFNSFRGSGLVPEPNLTQLDSNVWRIAGLSDGDGQFGATYLTGDWARGSTSSFVSIGGVYSFNHGTELAPDWALGFQPTGSDLTPGALTMQLLNGTQTRVDWVCFAFDLMIRNNEDRSSHLSLAYGHDDSYYQEAENGVWITGEQKSERLDWETYRYEETFSVIGLRPGSPFYLCWSFRDLAGRGSRDEVAIDNLKVEFGQYTSQLPEASLLGWLLSALALTLPFRVPRLRIEHQTSLEKEAS